MSEVYIVLSKRSSKDDLSAFKLYERDFDLWSSVRDKGQASAVLSLDHMGQRLLNAGPQPFLALREESPLTELEEENDAHNLSDSTKLSDCLDDDVEEEEEEAIDHRRFITRKKGDRQFHILRTRYSHRRNQAPPYPRENDSRATEDKIDVSTRRLHTRNSRQRNKKPHPRKKAPHPTRDEVDASIRKSATSESKRRLPGTLNEIAEAVSQGPWHRTTH